MKPRIDAIELKRTAADIARLARALDRDVSIPVRSKSTSAPSLAAKRWGKSTGRKYARLKRGPEENREIILKHEQQGRDVLYLSDRERRWVVTDLEKGLARDIERLRSTLTAYRAAVKPLGKNFARWIRNHIHRSKGEDGGLRPNPPRVREFKERVYGATKVLIRTGQMIRSLYAEDAHV